MRYRRRNEFDLRRHALMRSVVCATLRTKPGRFQNQLLEFLHLHPLNLQKERLLLPKKHQNLPQKSTSLLRPFSTRNQSLPHYLLTHSKSLYQPRTRPNNRSRCQIHLKRPNLYQILSRRRSPYRIPLQNLNPRQILSSLLRNRPHLLRSLLSLN